MHTKRWLEWYGKSIWKVSRHIEIFRTHENILSVSGGKGNSEGDYQCIASVKNISLSNKQIVDTILASPPRKMKRARITRFDKTTEYMVSARQGQVARLPCIGIPDVIPGPPELCFEKEGTQGCFKEPMDDAFITTSTGMQITNVQPQHSGNYYCVVRNEYTKSTKKSQKPVILLVIVGDQNDNDVDNKENVENELDEDLEYKPELVYPSRPSTFAKPLDYDVVAGQTVLLECVIANAQVHWVRHTMHSQRIISPNEDYRFHLLWGNLEIRHSKLEDSGMYSCHGIPTLNNTNTTMDYVYPIVYYNLIVHRPTKVQMRLTENPFDNSWELFCNASHMKFEIPMVYVNGTNLLDMVPAMGIALETNFFSNPITITLRPNESFSGSVQCISRPAMDEAEIYGVDMDRGTSQNLFISSTKLNERDLIIEGPRNSTVLVGDSVYLVCNTTRVKSRYWRKNGSYVRVYEKGGRASIIGSHTLHIKNVQASDEGWYTCIVTGEGNLENSAKAYLKVILEPEPVINKTEEEMVIPANIVVENFVVWIEKNNSLVFQWHLKGTKSDMSLMTGQRIETQVESDKEKNDNPWTEFKLLGPDVRKISVESFNETKRQRFRLALLFENGPSIISSENHHVTLDTHALKSLALWVRRMSSTDVHIKWKRQAVTESDKAQSYILSYWSTKTAKNVITLPGNTSEITLNDLDPFTSYLFQMRVVTISGSSILSHPFEIANTRVKEKEQSCGLMSCESFISFFSTILFISIILIAGATCFKKRTRKAVPSHAIENSDCKFLDTSFTIYREHRINDSVEKDSHSLATTCLVHDAVDQQLITQDVADFYWSQDCDSEE
ncbi:unnamed protein product [Auanema sp. JU1783]|nr:unnamed protein product [Auanema sp. JU1783]